MAFLSGFWGSTGASSGAKTARNVSPTNMTMPRVPRGWCVTNLLTVRPTVMYHGRCPAVGLDRFTIES